MAVSINAGLGGLSVGLNTTVTPTRSSPLIGNWTPALFRPKNRSICGIVAEVTIEESGSDDLQITEHPVEQGSPIADHAFKRPATLTIRAGWSSAGSYDLGETGVYGNLLAWQVAFLPFDVVTGKRSYSNMLMERIAITTDEHSEFALMATITCKQIFIVSTQTSEVQTTAESPSDHKEPEKTAGEDKKGEGNPSPVGSDSTLGDTPDDAHDGDGAKPESSGGGGGGTGAPSEPKPTPDASTQQNNPTSDKVSGTAEKNTPPSVQTEKEVDLKPYPIPPAEGELKFPVFIEGDQKGAPQQYLSSSRGPTRMIGGSSTPVNIGY